MSNSSNHSSGDYPYDYQSRRGRGGRGGCGQGARRAQSDGDSDLARVDDLRTGEADISSALGQAVRGLYEKGSASARARALWGEVVGPVGVRHTRGIYVKEPEDPEDPDELPTLYVYLDSSTFVYEYLTDRILYEQRLAYLGFPVRELVPRLSRSAGMPAPATPMGPTPLGEAKPKARPLDELEPLDEESEQWARHSVQSLPDGLADAIYGAMTSTMRRNQSEEG